MRLRRREVLKLGTGAAMLPMLARAARAQNYPARPIHLLVGFPAGGTADIIARLIGQGLSERLGQPVVVEVRPGAGGNIATEAVVRAQPDGYTLLLLANPNVIASMITANVPFSMTTDIAPVGGVSISPLVMEVNPSLPAKSVPEFIAYAKANPGKINMASGGTGSTPHLAGELFKMMTGVQMLHVPYHGDAPAVADLLGGQVQVLFDQLILSVEHIRAGTLRALAVTSTEHIAALPDLPTVAEFVPGYAAAAWQGIGAPKSTPPEIVQKLNAAIGESLADPKMQARLADIGGTPMPMTPADFGKLVATEIDKWAKVIKFADIRAG
jgi:tripartite-type tricarboxylate transporter receptor subunit TctC